MSTLPADMPIDMNSVRKFQQMGCEELTDDAARKKCYEPEVEKMTKAQEQAAIIRAAIGGTFGVLMAVGLCVGVYLLLVKRNKPVAKSVAVEAAAIPAASIPAAATQ